MNTSAEHGLTSGDIHQRFRYVAGRKILFDKDDFLWHVDDWTEQVAEALALECGIEKLSDLQWSVINFLRNYFQYHGRSPLNHDLKAGLSMSLMDIECLFPGGIKHGARRLAGLPNPRTCAG